jgi:hypothetical protein
MLVHFTAIRYILEGLAVKDIGIFYGHLVSMLWRFGIFFPVLVCCTKKNLAALRRTGPVSISQNVEHVCQDHSGDVFSIGAIEWSTMPFFAVLAF